MTTNVAGRPAAANPRRRRTRRAEAIARGTPGRDRPYRIYAVARAVVRSGGIGRGARRRVIVITGLKRRVHIVRVPEAVSIRAVHCPVHARNERVHAEGRIKIPAAVEHAAARHAAVAIHAADTIQAADTVNRRTVRAAADNRELRTEFAAPTLAIATYSPRRALQRSSASVDVLIESAAPPACPARSRGHPSLQPYCRRRTPQPTLRKHAARRNRSRADRDPSWRSERWHPYKPP